MNADEAADEAPSKRSRSWIDWLTTALVSILSLLVAAMLWLLASWMGATLFGTPPTPEEQAQAEQLLCLAYAIAVVGGIGPWIIRRAWYATTILTLITVGSFIASRVYG